MKESAISFIRGEDVRPKPSRSMINECWLEVAAKSSRGYWTLAHNGYSCLRVIERPKKKDRVRGKIYKKEL